MVLLWRLFLAAVATWLWLRLQQPWVLLRCLRLFHSWLCSPRDGHDCVVDSSVLIVQFLHIRVHSEESSEFSARARLGLHWNRVDVNRSLGLLMLKELGSLGNYHRHPNEQQHLAKSRLVSPDGISARQTRMGGREEQAASLFCLQCIALLATQCRSRTTCLPNMSFLGWI